MPRKPRKAKYLGPIQAWRTQREEMLNPAEAAKRHTDLVKTGSLIWSSGEKMTIKDIEELYREHGREGSDRRRPYAQEKRKKFPTGTIRRILSGPRVNYRLWRLKKSQKPKKK